LIGHFCGVAHDHVDSSGLHIEFFGNDLRQCRANTSAQIHVAIEGEYPPVVGDCNEDLRNVREKRRPAARLTREGLRWQSGLSDDAQAAEAAQQRTPAGAVVGIHLFHRE